MDPIIIINHNGDNEGASIIFMMDIMIINRNGDNEGASRLGALLILQESRGNS